MSILHNRLDIAVIGAGVAGLTAAYLLQKKHRVTLFEKEKTLGGHARTFHVPDGPDAGLPLDIGFMVFNDRNYPNFERLIARLQGIGIGKTDMSFSYHVEQDGQTGYFPNPGQRPHDFHVAEELPMDRHRMHLLQEIVRFARVATRWHGSPEIKDLTLGPFLKGQHFSDDFIRQYIIPSTAAIWSNEPHRVLSDFPAAVFIAFMANHGMLSRAKVPQWQYIRGGCARYVSGIERQLKGALYTGTAVRSVMRSNGRLVIRTSQGESQFDRVVFAVHADQILPLLTDPSDEERRRLSAWEYQENDMVVHTDESVMPPERGAWASWNFRTKTTEYLNGESSSVNYYLNRLQGHNHTSGQYFATLNPLRPIAEEKVLFKTTFHHPVYTFESLASQASFPSLNGRRGRYFCGSYCGFGS